MFFPSIHLWLQVQFKRLDIYMYRRKQVNKLKGRASIACRPASPRMVPQPVLEHGSLLPTGSH